MRRSCYLGMFLVLLLPSALSGRGSEEFPRPAPQTDSVTVTDILGNQRTVPEDPAHILCSGPGALRLAVYLQAEDKVIAVDDMETRRPRFDARPYALANPEFKDLPTFGEFRGHDNPELIVSLDPQPQVIFKTYPEMGTDPGELEYKTGIPVIYLKDGDLFNHKQDLYTSLRIMGRVLNREERAESVINFLESAIKDLRERTAQPVSGKKPSCFVGGIAHKGPHGIQSTEPAYPPFMFVNLRNLAYDSNRGIDQFQYADVAREQILAWDPDTIFIDVSTLQAAPEVNALNQLIKDPVYAELTSLKTGRIYGLLPYNWYSRNYGSIIANAYYIGKIIYPDRFEDIDPQQKADEIYTFLIGEEVFHQLNEAFEGLGFKELKDFGVTHGPGS